MNLRNILVHVDAGRHLEARLALARSLGARHDARVMAMYASALGAGNPTHEHLIDAQRRFNQLALQAGWPMTWLPPMEADPVGAFLRRCLTADLVVLGQRDPLDNGAFDLGADFVEQTIGHTGRPTLVVPGEPHGVYDRLDVAVLAWRATRDAAASMHAALPLLRHAREVHLVTWGDQAQGRIRDQQDAVDLLRLHGVDSIERHQGPLPHDVGDALLALAGGVGADLLVMGCYGHRPAQELVFGGATRTVLRRAHLPVLMAR